MKKILNGIEVDVPEEEAAQFQAEWTANAQPVVPQSVSMRQFRLGLLAINKLDAALPAIDALESPAREMAQIAWDSGGDVRRDDAWVAQIAPALSLDASGLDDLFIVASGS
jgi:hypothetical protein